MLIALVFPLLTYSLPGTVKINTVPCSIITNAFPDSLKGLLGILSGLLPFRAAKDKIAGEEEDSNFFSTKV